MIQSNIFQPFFDSFHWYEILFLIKMWFIEIAEDNKKFIHHLMMERSTWMPETECLYRRTTQYYSGRKKG